MHLLQLPTEILTQIAVEAIPEAFEAYLLSCKTLFAAAESSIARYKLAKQYQNFSYRFNIVSSCGWRIRTPTQLLYEIARRPEIADVIAYADFRAFHPDLYHEESGQDGDPHWWDWVDTDFAENLSKFISDSPRLAALDLNHAGNHVDNYPGTGSNSYMSHIVNAENLMEASGGIYYEGLWDFLGPTDTAIGFDLATTLLLALLSNLRTVSVSNAPVGCDVSHHPELMSSIIRKSNEKSSLPNAARPLPCLREVHPSWPRNNGIECDMSNLAKLLQVESLEVYHQTNCIALSVDDYGVPLNIAPGSRYLGMRELVLWASVFGPKETHTLVSCMPRLEIFRLEQGVKWDEPEDGEPQRETYDVGWETFSPGGIADALLRTAGGRLRGLGLTIDFNVGECVTAVNNLRAFEKLEDLELSSNVFFSDWVENMTEDEEKEHIRARLPRLVDVLPRSLRRLRIRTANDAVSAEPKRHGLPGLFRDFASTAEATLPELEIVEIVSDPEQDIEQEGPSAISHGTSRDEDKQGKGKEQFPQGYYDPDILDLLTGLDQVELRAQAGFRFLTFRQGPPSWFEAAGHET